MSLNNDDQGFFDTMIKYQRAPITPRLIQFSITQLN